jgi:DNA-binding NarL/FixJ family response regulator
MNRAVALEKAAAELEREASNLRRRAKTTRETDKHMANLKKARHGLLLRVRTLIQEGQKYPCRILSMFFKLPEETIALFYYQALKDEKQKTRRRRDRSIMQDARAGKTNAQIGLKYQLHPKTIQKIIRRDIHSLFRKFDSDHD